MKDFHCEAYGPDLPDTCFVELVYGRCGTAAECHTVMDIERHALWDRLHVLEALGDDMASELLEHFTGPGELLGGSET